jgi:membrane protein YqaA with SNARE-associated domain
MVRKQIARKTKKEINMISGNKKIKRVKPKRPVPSKNTNIVRKNNLDKELIAIKDENKDGYIVLKQESLYKPLLIVFGIFLFAMIILFPTSIFDEIVPGVMDFLRLLVNLSFLSAVATLLPLPVSFSDANLIRIILLPEQYSDLYTYLTALFIVTSDTFFALVAYKFTNTLRRMFASKTKAKDEKKANERFRKYGNLAMFLGAATPLPFTLMIYTAGALKLPKKGFLISVFVGRFVKYALITLPFRLFNFDIIAWGGSLWTSLMDGQLNIYHYSILVVIGLLTIWLVLSILGNIKKSRATQI